ncbi:MAG: rRNA maturation RNase YbeY [Bdellovibrio sp.]
MNVLIVNESKHAVPRKFINDWIARMISEFKKRKILKASQSELELTLVFLNKAPAKKLNFEFRQKNYATDVLSFDSLDNSSLGELILCPEVLKQQAKEHGLSYKLELGYMLLHGVLHLLGYEHETNDTDAQKMFRLQDAVFEKLS